jgi:hypothetical protein
MPGGIALEGGDRPENAEPFDEKNESRRRNTRHNSAMFQE